MASSPLLKMMHCEAQAHGFSSNGQGEVFMANEWSRVDRPRDSKDSVLDGYAYYFKNQAEIKSTYAKKYLAIACDDSDGAATLVNGKLEILATDTEKELANVIRNRKDKAFFIVGYVYPA